MVNVAGRSRGCATCRKRKVKCDESVPECLRCLNMGLRCPGARTESFFVHAVSSSSSCRPLAIPARSLVPSPRLPGPQPSSASALDQLFVSHFIETFFGPMKPPPIPNMPSKTWLHELPVFLVSPGPSLVKHAIRAASMHSYGSFTNDISIKTAACKCYAKALQDLQCLLSCESISFAEGVLCAIVMLIHFETRAGTSQRAWLQHIKGAAMLLEAGGPERCRSGFMHHMFSHLRLQVFIAAMAENEVSAFASQAWMTIPFEIYPKLVFDQLIDVLFGVQRCLSVASQLIRSAEHDARELVTKLDKLLQDAMFQMHQWWSGCISSGVFGQTNLMQKPNFNTKPSFSCDLKEQLLPFTNIPAAALSCLYDAANLIIFRLSHLVSPAAASYDMRIQKHAQSILSAYHFIIAASGPAPDRGSIMMVLQLKVVSLWSPSSQQRALALGMLQGEKVQGGGLSDVAAVSHEYFADVAAHILQHYSGK
ncbi:hypothetical protein BKA56DRAFT_678925 [Ilyonectria sp. MPI-CAGE-AT-0026]|nr:hypothetical protein BKA56DRAFT_678925 [Ilyonectria sp. MPI-CAGE-AT-0026]